MVIYQDTHRLTSPPILQKAFYTSQKPLPELFDYVLERSGYSSRLLDGSAEDGNFEAMNALDELRQMTLKYPDVAAFLTAMEEIGDELAAQDEGVSLATLHAVKGLGFPVVFIVGLEEGLFPHAKSNDSQTALNEEYRLFYVGLTRVQQKLYLSYPLPGAQRAGARNAAQSFLADFAARTCRSVMPPATGCESICASMGRMRKSPPD